MPRSKIIIYWSQADEAFIAEVLELPGCAADGRDLQGSSSRRRNHHSGMDRNCQDTPPSHPRAAGPPRLRLSVSAERFRAPAKEKAKSKTHGSVPLTISYGRPTCRAPVLVHQPSHPSIMVNGWLLKKVGIRILRCHGVLPR